MKLVIYTQYVENHSYRWKCKGGSIFVVEGITKETPVENVLDSLSPLIEYDNSMSKEYITSGDVVNDERIPWEEWGTPIFLEQDGKATIISKPDEFSPEGYKGKVETFVLKEGQEREHYRCTYL